MFKKYTQKTPSEFIKNYSPGKVDVDSKVENKVKIKASF